MRPAKAGGPRRVDSGHVGTGARVTTGAAEHPGFGFVAFRGWFGGAKRHKPKADWAGSAAERGYRC
ncbi:hypothetical protein Cst04h_24690 [Corynebacterium striatum]|uniref:Uncharacterized protein n=1 Tax=Corynebacterium striatum TaxID=43770 RepID=A0ABC9ZQ25_CORST|nr:hypothetical protein Cst04h_24690 [Corynebacterium striatum]